MGITKAKCFKLLLVLTLVMLQAAECKSRKEIAFKSGGGGGSRGAATFPSFGNRNEMPEDWELRRVPAGPDPLHHNGHSPTKPRTP